MERRTVLIMGTAVAAGSVVAACGSRDTAGGDPAAAASAAPPPAGAVAAISAVPVGGGYVNTDIAVVVTQPDAGSYRAFTAVCPHQGCLVSRVVDNEIICPCHNSRFSAVDGAVVSGPAQEGLAAARVAIDGDAIILA